MKKGVKLYNVIFPIWMLLLFPQMWLISMPANFVIDFLVLYFSMKYLQIEQAKEKAKSVIWKTWGVGFGADIVGGFFMFLVPLIEVDMETVFGKWWYENMTNAVMYDPFENVYALLFVTLCVIITSLLIYIINKKWCLKSLEITEAQRQKIALYLAIFTAPYLFYLPTKWFW